MANPSNPFPIAVPAASGYRSNFASSDMYVGVPAIAAGLAASAIAGTGSFTATLTGVQVTDMLFLEPPTNLSPSGVTAGCSVMYAGHKITAADTVVVYFRSVANAAVAAQTAVAWTYKWFSMTPKAEVLGQNPS